LNYFYITFKTEMESNQMMIEDDDLETDKDKYFECGSIEI